MVSLLSVASSAGFDQQRIELAEEAVEAERQKTFLLDFIERHFPYYWRRVGTTLVQSNARFVGCQELGLQLLPAVEIGEFLLALDVRANDDRKVVVITQDDQRVVGVVEISADQPSPSRPEGLSAADVRLTQALSQNLR